MEVTKWLKPSISVSRIGDSCDYAGRNASERRAQGLSRSAVALPWPRAPSFPGRALTDTSTAEHAGCGRDDDQRGALPSGAGSSRHNLVFGRSVAT